jgi:TRAP-type C4-dicarboxylate transport system substrate-binding protein
VIELSIAYAYVPGSNEDLNINRWAKKTEEDSKGRLKFKIFGGGVLANAFENYHGIIKGVADIGFGVRYGVGTPFSDDIISTALMGAPNVATATLVVDDLIKKYADVYAKEWGDTKILWRQADQSSSLITRAGKPVKTLEDMKGLQLRAPIKSVVEALKAMGAKPVSMPLPDFILGLQKGIVDGGTIAPWGVKAHKFPSVAKYYTEFVFVTAPTVYAVVNWNKWKALPPDLQRLLEDNSEWGKRETVKMLDEEAQAAKDWAKKQGMEFITLNKEEEKRWVATIEPVYLKLASELDAKGYPATSAFKYARERLAYHMK